MRKRLYERTEKEQLEQDVKTILQLVDYDVKIRTLKTGEKVLVLKEAE